MRCLQPAAVLTLLTVCGGAAHGHGHGDAAPQAPVPVRPTQAAPPRAPRPSVGGIRGRVLASESGSPLRRAHVRLVSSAAAPRQTTTDAAGVFEFAGLPEGRYTITASKTGYLTMQHGQRRPLEMPRALALAEKQWFDKADIVLPRGSAIVGRVIDEVGEPAAEVMVSVTRLQWVNGRRQPMNAGRPSQTDDLGQYRVYGLAPGDYYVSATAPPDTIGPGAMLELPGQVGARPAQPGTSYAPSFYPGTPSPGEALPVAVAAGQDSFGVDFQLVPSRLARVSGVVVNAEGHPIEAMLTIVPARGRSLASLFGGNRSSRDGAFTLGSVAPGEYVIHVRSVSAAPGQASVPAASSAPVAPQEVEFATVPVALAGDDLFNLVIVTIRGAKTTGRVQFEGGRPPALNAVRVTSLDVSDTPLPLMGATGPGALVQADGTFEVAGLVGPRVFRVAGLPAAWVVKSIQLNGVDVTDSGVDYQDGTTSSGLEIVVSSKSTDVSGAVTGAGGKPVTDYTVVFFSQDPQKWRVPGTRWVTAARSSQDGRFRVQHLPPGAYYAAAVDFIPQGEWNDADVLDRLKSKAQTLSIGAGESRTVELKLTVTAG